MNGNEGTILEEILNQIAKHSNYVSDVEMLKFLKDLRMNVDFYIKAYEDNLCAKSS